MRCYDDFHQQLRQEVLREGDSAKPSNYSTNILHLGGLSCGLGESMQPVQCRRGMCIRCIGRSSTATRKLLSSAGRHHDAGPYPFDWSAVRRSLTPEFLASWLGRSGGVNVGRCTSSQSEGGGQYFTLIGRTIGDLDLARRRPAAARDLRSQARRARRVSRPAQGDLDGRCRACRSRSCCRTMRGCWTRCR